MADLLNKVGEILPKDLKDVGKQRAAQANGETFSELLKKSLDETNELSQQGERAAVDVATGQVKDLHKAAIAIGKAENSMKLLLEVRNKAVSAYKELLRTQM
ncbi:MAG: flagellar hook-basal body complex protein FliE [Helicobacteraceae bacterium]